MYTEMRLSEEQQAIVKMGSRIEEYYYLPFWFKDIGDGLFELHNFENLPENLKQKINYLRYGTNTTNNS